MRSIGIKCPDYKFNRVCMKWGVLVVYHSVGVRDYGRQSDSAIAIRRFVGCVGCVNIEIDNQASTKHFLMRELANQCHMRKQG